MARLFRLTTMGIISMLAGSGLLGQAVDAPELATFIPSAHVAEAAEVDWQLAFPNGDFEDGAYAPSPPPANHTFSSGLSSWTVNTSPVTAETGGPSGTYALLGEGGTLTSSTLALVFEDDGFQTISFDYGFFEASSVNTDAAYIHIYAITDGNDVVLVKTDMEAAEFLPAPSGNWGTYTYDIGDLLNAFESNAPDPEDEIVALRFVADGVVGIDNVAVQGIQLPGWSWWGETPPTIETSGPEGNYVRLTSESAIYLDEYVEIPEGARNFAYRLRVSEEGAASILVEVGDGDEFGIEWAIDSIESGSGEWTKRIVNLEGCPEEEVCLEIRVYVSAIDGTVDFSLASLDDDSDIDEDGIYDEWEEYGVLMHVPEASGEFIDLPAMGSDPDKPDVFVHLDYMEENSEFGRSQRLEDSALEKVVEAFANSPYESPTSSVGINLHIDQGPDSILDFETESTWGSLSRAGIVPWDLVLGSFSGSTFLWEEFQDFKDEYFLPTGRLPIFHYAIAAYRHGALTNDSSGISRGIPHSDFIISLGNFFDEHGTVNEQAGTFMHELGHNLGLTHGGTGSQNYKPNYLSVMNYSFQFLGLIEDSVAGNFDYSRMVINIDESNLDERVGLGSLADGFGTVYYCGDDEEIFWGDSNGQIDWNCDSAISNDPVATDLTNDDPADATYLDGFNDWLAIDFFGGAIEDEGSGIRRRSSHPRVEAHSDIGFSEAVERGVIDLSLYPISQRVR